MKKLIALMVVAAFATTAYGAAWTMNWSHVEGVGSIVGDTATLYESDTAYFEVWLELADSDWADGYTYALSGSSVSDPRNYVWTSFTPGAGVYEINPPDFAFGLENWVGNGFIDQYFVAVHGPAEILLGTFDIHCTGDISEDVIKFGLSGGVDYFYSYMGSVINGDASDAIAGLQVIQVPEPASLALLALGGLALIRRR